MSKTEYQILLKVLRTSDTQIAAALGVTHAAVSAVTNRRRQNDNMRERIAKHLAGLVTPALLFEETTDSEEINAAAA